jgi:hypothetical protein
VSRPIATVVPFDVTVTAFVSSPALVALTVTRNVLSEFGGTVGIVHVNGFGPDDGAGVALTNVRPVGSGSVTTTLGSGAVPWLMKSIRYVTVPLSGTRLAFAVFCATAQLVTRRFTGL